MSILTDLREKYPQYNVLSDKELADRFHQKYYSEMPINAYYEKIGYSEPAKGWEGVGEDIGKSLKEVPTDLWEMIKQLPGEVFGAATHPGRIPQNLGAGLAQGGAGILNTPANIRDYLASKNIISNESPSLRLPESILPKNYNYAEGVGLEGTEPGDALVQGIGASAPYVAGGELGALGIPARVGARAGAQGAFATGQNENPIKAAAMPASLEGLARGLPRLYEAAKPTKLFRGNLPAEDLAANVRAAQGTNTDIGNIIGSPTLKQVFENLTTKWPGSGADKLLGKMANQVESRSEGLLAEAGEGIPAGDRNSILKKTIENVYDKQLKRKNELYKPVNKLAENEAFKLELPSLEKFSKEFGAAVNKSPLMKNDPALKKTFNEISKYKKATESTQLNTLGADALMSKPIIKYPSIVDAKALANRLDTESSKHMRSPNPTDHFIASKFSDAAKSIRKDVKDQIMEKGSPELKSAYKAAEKNYAENYSQFLDKDVYKLTRPDVDSQTIINDIIKPGKQGDKYTRIEKIQKLLPENQRNILGEAWLRNAIDKEGALNPKQFSQMINKLGPRQFEALFPDPAFRQKLLDYGRLRGMNEKALSRMANPATGQSLGVPTMIGSQIAGVTNAAMSGNLPMVAAYGLGPQIGSNLMNKLLTNPATREKFIAKMLKNEAAPPKIPKKLKGLPFLTTPNYEIYDED